MGYTARVVFAVVIAFLIGASSRWFEIPVPAPPKLLGAILILSITLGYVVTDSLIDNSERSVTETSESNITRSLDEDNSSKRTSHSHEGK